MEVSCIKCKQVRRKKLKEVNISHILIINSGEFINKIADLEVPPGRKLVSYDVSALSTSIPINDGVSKTGGAGEG